MPAANDNLRILEPDERAAFIERVCEEFDLLSLGIPSPDRIRRELAVWGYA